MRLEGTLDAFSLPDIFALLSMTKKSGGLHLRREDAHGVVCFTTGSLTGGSSDLTRQALARRLAGAGHVSDDRLTDAVERVSADPTIGLARALQPTVDEAALHDLVTEHVIDAVFDLMRWPNGEFAFLVDEGNPDDVGVSLPVDEVVAEVRRRLETWSGVAATVPSPQTVPCLPLAPAVDPVLSRDEWALLALVDGRRSVGELVALSGRGEYAAVSLLAALVARGLLHVDAEDGVTALLRRQALLAGLEAPSLGEGPATEVDDAVEAPAVPEPVAERATAPQPPLPRPEPEVTRPDLHIAEPAPPLAARDPALVGHAEAVTPARPEPFLPKRRPEHPEESIRAPRMSTTSVEGTAAVAPNVSTHIERDPSVNKSLLLRLIAGVRGL
ncbi:MAG TPA: DUF4388 domain-containing protein [Mycobacteriales bacterium]|nr:DUF4388 domain-containing protein [Mycobacteriales bacterium]